ncbi:MAG: T9SS type A sorting domain-containing protein [Bacteroidales bacterium]|nr:T9SS type A sorting domain-containing protein [Bacteroidales bacterium]
MKRIATIVLFIFFVLGCYAQYLNPNEFPLVTEPEISLKTIDHNSEGFLVTWDTVIYHFFRQDPGYTGNHTGNSGRIMMRKSFDNGDTWTTPEVIFDGPYDDRNVHGGITENGRIIVNFRQYNASTQQHIEYDLIYSDDFGQTWNGPITIPTIAVASGTHQIFGNNLMGYYNIIYTHKYCELRHSWDGIQWDSIVYVWDYRLNNQYKISEASFVYLGNGVMVGLFRNDSGVLGESYLQVESYDYGKNWTEPKLTNIADGFFCPSPWIFYDYAYNHVWIIAIDRRGIFPPTYIHNWSSIWLYKAYPDEILGNPHEYSPFLVFLRPKPSFFRIYGYPVTTKTPNGNYLVIFTESEYRNKGEWAYLYQFKIIYHTGPSVKVEENNAFSSRINIFPNPAQEFVNIIGNSNANAPKAELSIYNAIGQLIHHDDMFLRVDGSYRFVVNVSQFSQGLYRCVVKTGEEIKTLNFIRD